MKRRIAFIRNCKSSFYPNQFVVMKDALGGSSSALGIVDHLGKKVKKLIFPNEQVWGIRPRNVQQIMGLELLLREDIPLVTLRESWYRKDITSFSFGAHANGRFRVI